MSERERVRECGGEAARVREKRGREETRVGDGEKDKREK
jgi:hypothetical protein